MARPKINPRVRFANEIKLWKIAEITSGAAYECESGNAAIHKMHRLHMARSALREELGVGAHPWDIYTVRLQGNMLEIVVKKPLDMTRFKDKDGNAISEEKINQMLADDERDLTDDEVKEQMRLMHEMLEKDKDIANAQKLHFDPNKPLTLDTE